MCNRFGENRDKLYVMDADARVLDTIEAPQDRLIWQARYMADAGVVLLRADHQIMTLSLESRAFKALTPMNKTPASFLSTAGSLASWYAEPDVVVCDMKDGRTLFRKEILRPALRRPFAADVRPALGGWDGARVLRPSRRDRAV